MNKNTHATPLDTAIACFNGNQSALARAIDPSLSTMAITHWKNRGVPASRYHDIQQACGGTVTTDDFFAYAKKSKAA